MAGEMPDSCPWRAGACSGVRSCNATSTSPALAIRPDAGLQDLTPCVCVPRPDPMCVPDIYKEGFGHSVRCLIARPDPVFWLTPYFGADNKVARRP
jgi:hypothetical protein